MIKKLIVALFVLCMAQISLAGVFQNLEQGAEIAELDLGRSGSGLIYARLCDYCELLALSIGPQTRYFAGNKPLRPVDLEDYRNRGATVFFEPESKEITRVVFWE